MTNLTPVSSFDNVRQLETTDLGLAGPGGPLNEQAQALLNRTKYLNDRRVLLEAFDTSLLNTADPAQGAAMIGRGAQVVDSFDALGLLSKDSPSKFAFATACNAAYQGLGGGHYRLDSTDTISPEIRGICKVAADGGRWKLNQSSPVTIQQIGAIPGVFDAPTQAINNTAFQAARDWVAANAVRNKLVFTAGIYGYSLSPNWAIPGADISFEGDVRLRYFGTGNAVVLDAGPLAGDLCYNLRFGATNRPIIECPSTALDTMFVRSVHHSKVGMVPRGAGTANAALHVQFAVCTEFNITPSVNEAGWYLGAKPAVGIKLDKRLTGESTSYCYFPNNIVEGPDVGIHLVSTLGNIFIGGTSEACSQYGVFAEAGASGDRFFGMDFEANGIADVYSLGNGVEVDSCDSDNEISFGVGATLCRVHGGRHKDILFDIGSIGCSATDTIYNRSNNGGTFIDLGDNSVVRGVRNGGTNLLYLTGSVLGFNPPSIATGTIFQTNVTVSGAVVGDKAEATFTQSIQALAMSATVSAVDTVTVTWVNLSGAPVDLAPGTLSASVQRGN